MNGLTFQGRMNRLTYFLHSLAVGAVMYGIGFLLKRFIVPGETTSVTLGLLLSGVSLVCLIYGLSLAVRRLHDLDKSGWWALLFLLPVVNFLLGIVLLFIRGTTGPNRFGPDPLAPTTPVMTPSDLG